MSDGFAGSTTNTSEKLEKEVEARLAKADKQSKAKEGLMSSKRRTWNQETSLTQRSF
jgi:hypothetical protein